MCQRPVVYGLCQPPVVYGFKVRWFMCSTPGGLYVVNVRWFMCVSTYGGLCVLSTSGGLGVVNVRCFRLFNVRSFMLVQCPVVYVVKSPVVVALVRSSYALTVGDIAIAAAADLGGRPTQFTKMTMTNTIRPVGRHS